MSFEATALLLAWVMIVILAFAMAGLLRQVHALSTGRPVRRLGLGLQVGTPAPELSAPTVLAGATTALVFADNACATCEVVLPELARLAKANGDRALRFAAVYRNGKSEIDTPALAVLEGETEAFENYRIPATPFGVVVARDGTVADAQPIGSVEVLHQFVRRAILLAGNQEWGGVGQ
jgi:hypothetical protein